MPEILIVVLGIRESSTPAGAVEPLVEGGYFPVQTTLIPLATSPEGQLIEIICPQQRARSLLAPITSN